ncbi:MAG TPA: hypothetical protein VMY99_01395 [Nevskiaceae bacterium]|nr:hypothetical protein [Nevskiaceae bacterium]
MGQFDNYRPSDEVLDKLKHITLVAVVGASGVGKTTLMKAAAQADPALQFVIADVSRRARPEERDGVDYNFCRKQDMLQRIKRHEYVNVAPSLGGDLYTTDPISYPDKGLGMMAIWAGVIPYFRSLPFAAIRTIFIVPASFEVWQRHMHTHHFTPDQQAQRLAEARRSFEFGLHDKQSVLIINDDLQAATQDFLQAVRGRQPITDQQQARAVIRNVLQQLP